MIKISAKETIKEYMRKEALKPESAFKMPSMRKLTKHFNVSLVTVTRAIKDLEAEKVVICRHGSGIVAARESCSEVNSPGQSEQPKNGSLVLAVVDYPSETIWNRAYITELYARQKGFRIVNCKVHQDTVISDIIDFANKQEDCSGILLMLGSMKLSMIEIEAFSKLSIPIVLINHMFNYEPLPDNIYMVGPDPKAAGRLVADYLYQKGHRSIGLIRNEPATEYSDSYVQGATNALKQAEGKAKLHYFPSIIRNWDNSGEEARRITLENVEKIRNLNITALIYLSGYGAFASLPILKEAGFRLPEELSVITSADAWFCEYADPALTSTAPDCRAMCFRAVDIISDKRFRKNNFFKVEEKLKERKSVSILNNSNNC